MKIEKRYLNQSLAGIELRADDENNKSEISGYASVFYNGSEETEYELWDGAVERIAEGAFDAAIANDDIRGLFNHDPNMLLGRNKAGTLSLSVDETGLKYNIDLPDTQVGNDVNTSVKRGDLSGSSFSFQPTRVEWIDEGDKEVRLIKEVSLFDVGPVTFPAYKGSSAFARDTSAAEDEHEKIENEKKEADEAKRKEDKAKADADYADAAIQTLGK